MERVMPLQMSSVKQIVVLAAVALALIVSSVSPILDAHDVAAKNRDRKTGASNQVVAESIQAFSDPSPIPIGNVVTTGPFSIAVSGFETPLADVNVTLVGLTSSNPGDLDVLLVGPTGQTAFLISDVGANIPANGVTLSLDDQAANQVSSFQAMTSGAFQPTNFDIGDTFNAPPAPTRTPASGAELGVFNGSDPNGTWSLFIRDDTDNGSLSAILGGWSLQITSANGVPRAEPDRFQATAGQTLNVPANGVLGNDVDPDDDSLIALLAGQPRQGTLSLQVDGSFTYKSNKKAKGTDSFTYLAKDSSGLDSLATVTIQIKAKKHKKGKGKK
jgi:VCBS repeat-containing protein